MPKMKTRKSVKKRFKKTASGKLKHRHAFTSHILTSKGKKRKRQLRKRGYLNQTDQNRMSALIPYL